MGQTRHSGLRGAEVQHWLAAQSERSRGFGRTPHDVRPEVPRGAPRGDYPAGPVKIRSRASPQQATQRVASWRILPKRQERGARAKSESSESS
jgi:hypothetical protein